MQSDSSEEAENSSELRQQSLLIKEEPEATLMYSNKDVQKSVKMVPVRPAPELPAHLLNASRSAPTEERTTGSKAHQINPAILELQQRDIRKEAAEEQAQPREVQAHPATPPQPQLQQQQQQQQQPQPTAPQRGVHLANWKNTKTIVHARDESVNWAVYLFLGIFLLVLLLLVITIILAKSKGK